MKDVYNPPLEMIKYKFNEKEKIGKVRDYIDSTYDKHYSHGGEQAVGLVAPRSHEQFVPRFSVHG